MMERVRRILVATTALLVSVVPVGTAANADELVIAVPNWPSAEATAHIMGVVLEEKLNIDVTYQPAGTLGIFNGIDNGKIHVHPEVWLPNLTSLVEKYRDKRGTIALSENGVAASQNMCVTRYTAEVTGVKSVSDLADPKMSAKFDSDNDGQGEIWIGAATWSSTMIERIRAKSYGYADTMRLLQMPEDVAMATVDASIAVGRPFVFYCYKPHHLFRLHDIVVLEEDTFDADKWEIVFPADDANWLQKSRAETGWDASHFHVGFAAKLKEEMPEAASFFENITFTSDDITTMSYALQVERQEPAKFAKKWVAENSDRIKGWLQ
ncbi:MAG: glycine betaine ABC transporter substrate-binding protein [Pseudomonadota bacterium]